MSRTTLVLGGPGCGKTHKLLDFLEAELRSGVKPHEIGFVAFTRKAAHESPQRAAARFGLTEDDLPYFKTLHALAFQQLGLATSEVMSREDYAIVGREIGIPVSGADEETGMHTAPDRKGDQIAYLEQLSRLTNDPLDIVCAKHRMQRYWDVKLYADTLIEYKRSRHRTDFTDMLDRYERSGPFPAFRVLFVDEAQDLSPLQWRVVNKLRQNVDVVYIAGDDDQAIYEWSGADVEMFMSLKADERIVLPKSHRLPSNVFNHGVEILGRIRYRYPKLWGPVREGGSVEHYAKAENVDASKGSWYWLARNRYIAKAFEDILRLKGLPYIHSGHSSVDNDVVRSVLCWEHLRAGKPQPDKFVRKMLARLRVGHGDITWSSGADDSFVSFEQITGLQIPREEDWMTAIRMPESDREYYRAVRRNGESLTNVPRITVSTIHQVKGGEADHVLLSPDMSYACFSNLQSNPDAEHRVFYVGATRAKESLHLLYPQTNKFYNL